MYGINKKICRLCLVDLKENEGASIFTFITFNFLTNQANTTASSDHKQKVSNFLMEFSSIKIDEMNDADDQICLDCLKRVTEFYLFKIQFELNDMKYREIKLSNNSLIPQNSGDDGDYDHFLFNQDCSDRNEVEMSYEIDPGEIIKEEYAFDNNLSYLSPENSDHEESELETKRPNYFCSCSICNCRIETRKHYDMHIRKHLMFFKEITKFKLSKEDIYNYYTFCQICLRKFNSYKAFCKHQKKSHKKCTLTCLSCQIDFDNLKEFQAHLNVQHELLKHACLKCLKSFDSSEVFKNHLTIRKQKPKGLNKNCLSCFICSKSQMNYFQIIEHMYTHFDLVYFTCKICQINFDSKKQLENHNMDNHDKQNHLRSNNQSTTIVKQNGEKTVQCQICNKVFGQNSYRTHMYYVHSEKRHKCHICQKKYSYSSLLADHLKSVHQIESEYKCSFDNCDKSFTTLRGVKFHEMFHTGEVRNIKTESNNKVLSRCQICGKNDFKSSNTRATHMRNHKMSNIMVQCKICNKTCKQRYYRSHLYTHEEPRFECRICPRKFVQQNAWKSHMNRIHSTERPYKCSIQDCEKAFKTKDRLVAHEQRHCQLT